MQCMFEAVSIGERWALPPSHLAQRVWVPVPGLVLNAWSLRSANRGGICGQRGPCLCAAMWRCALVRPSPNRMATTCRLRRRRPAIRRADVPATESQRGDWRPRPHSLHLVRIRERAWPRRASCFRIRSLHPRLAPTACAHNLCSHQPCQCSRSVQLQCPRAGGAALGGSRPSGANVSAGQAEQSPMSPGWCPPQAWLAYQLGRLAARAPRTAATPHLSPPSALPSLSSLPPGHPVLHALLHCGDTVGPRAAAAAAGDLGRHVQHRHLVCGQDAHCHPHPNSPDCGA